MVYFLRKFCAGMCCLALIGAFTAVSAAPATIHANAYMQTIYVDGQEAKFSNSEGKTAYLFSCNGVTYMPIQTAAAWLGCTVTVDTASKAAMLLSGVEPSIPGVGSTLPSTEEDYQTLDRYFEQGVDVQLLTDFTVTVDGVPWVFSNGTTTLFPFFVDDTLYVPMRNVGERMGKTVTWIPELQTEPHYQDEFISIDTPATTAQIVEMQNYIKQGMTLYQQANTVGQELLTANTLSNEETAKKLEEIKGLLQQIGQIPTPSYPYLDKYELPDLAINTSVFSTFDYYCARLRSGEATFQSLKSGNLDRAVTTLLSGRLATLNDAQHGLDCLVASAEQ